MMPAAIWQTMETKLIAILRGITTKETPAVVDMLIEEGFRAIEIPLNSPQPFDSIREAVRASDACGEPCLIGAGTVLTAHDVDRVREAGGNLVVSPNIDSDVVRHTLAQGMACFPGVFTASEIHLAVRLGATGLKIFPASVLDAAGIEAVLATVADDVQICAVGGVDADDFARYRDAGVQGFGLGSRLYRQGDSVDTIRDKARRIISAWKSAGDQP